MAQQPSLQISSPAMTDRRGTDVSVSMDAAMLKNSNTRPDGGDHSPARRRVSMRRAVEKTVDKLSLGSGGAQRTSSQSQSNMSQSLSSSRRLFSLSRKGKGRESDEREHIEAPASRPQSPQSSRIGLGARKHSRPTSPASPHSSKSTGLADDSPFIRPNSPSSPRPNESDMYDQQFRGDGSIRLGTQALIQALQAIPWTEDPDNDDDIVNHGLTPDPEIEEEARPELASSIHAIYRPLARFKRADGPPSPARDPNAEFTVNEDDESDSEDAEDDLDGIDDDFEAPTPRASDAATSAYLTELYSSTMPLSETVQEGSIPRRPFSRTGSMATVRLQRRTRLAEKLREVFDLKGIEEVWAEMPCWLLRSVLLQGYLYLTNSYLCFFAHMPTREDQILKSGSLYKKAQRTKRWIRHWFILKNDALSWYHSSSDPYFPHGIVDLRYAISCEPQGEKEIRLRTNQKTVLLSADSVPSREEWIKAIRKVIFKAQNMGDSVKIAIPYSAILDVEKSSAMDFSETIEIKVVDHEDHYSVDSYFFAYFHDLPAALDQIREAVRNYRKTPATISPRLVLDTTSPRTSIADPGNSLDRVQSLVSSENAPKPSSSFSLTSFLRPLRPFQDGTTIPRTPGASDSLEKAEDFTHISKRGDSSFVPVAVSPQTQKVELPDSSAESQANTTPTQTRPHHTYPPTTSATDMTPSSSRETSTISWGVGVPSWFKTSRKVTQSTANDDSDMSSPMTAVSEVYSSAQSPSAGRSFSGDLGYSVLEVPEAVIDKEIQDKFRSTFAFDDKEALLGYFPGYIFRLLPVFGRLYISAYHFCFKSSGPLASRTRMVLPLKDILAMEKSKGTRFGHYGLIIIIKGHEELFFEFGLEDRRNAFAALLDRQIDDVKKRISNAEAPSMSPGKRDALILEEFEPRKSDDSDGPKAIPDIMTDSLPAVMFTSSSSTFLTFKPKEPLRFTFLTIGSRGDVQPYIALSKGLMAEGHHCKIATHGEFREWIESHGIEYGYVGGDPAELMRICVENGMFTLSFMKETLQKFRGWLDDLLQTSWLACANTDVLMESPSAMGGIHIAEALGIPYFRAFTMPWSRTRAYPHAFAVPERKMGGSYNYMSYVMFDQVFWRATAGQINRWRRNTLGLGSTNLDKMEPHKIPFLYKFSPVVVPPPLDWPEWIQITGYWFLDDADVSKKKWTPPADLVKFIDDAHALGKKVVYIGFGSIVVSDPKSMTRSVVDAVVQSGVYAILSKGWSDRLHSKTEEASEPEEPLPKQIYPITSIPHDWLFTRIDAACHHGGAGTTGASLRAGLPTVIKPFFGDQFFWADRVEALGAGSAVRKLTVDSLTDAFVSATTDPKQIERARLIGEQIRAENGVATAIEAIYRNLEYAKSLVKRAPRDDAADNAVLAEEVVLRDDAGLSSSDPSTGDYPSSPSGRPPSEDWSVISDQEDRNDGQRAVATLTRELKQDRSTAFHKRNSLAAAVLSVLPDSLTGTTPPHRRSNSASSARS